MSLVTEQLSEVSKEKRADHLVLVVAKNTIDSVYPPMILATTAMTLSFSKREQAPSPLAHPILYNTK